jgi:hypothetical protein
MEATSYQLSSSLSPKVRSAPSPDEPAMLPSQPKPWETVVRMRIQGEHSVGMGSGTIIHSCIEESLVLTAAHYFKRGREGAPITDLQPEPFGAEERENAGVTKWRTKPQILEEYYNELFAMSGRGKVTQSKFPFKINIDLFDGKLTDSKPAQVHFLETVTGELVDCDFDRDVALIRIRPGRRIAASRVVPKTWQPQRGMQMLTIGCSEGHDATAWHTKITKPQVQNLLQGNPTYEAIECETAPKQGRSGGGLFTDDGFLAGVCNFAEPQGNHGLYAAPNSVYRLLDKNNCTFVYEPSAIDERRLADRILGLTERIERDTLELRRLKELGQSRSGDFKPAPPRAVDSGAVKVHRAEPTKPTPESSDHERRLREIERKLEQVLELLAGAGAREPNSVR